MAKKGSTYFKGLDKTLDNMMTYKSESEVRKLSGVLNVKHSLKGVTSTSNNKVNITDYRLSVINKWLTSRVELVVIKYSMRTGLKVSTETYTNNYNQSISIPTDKEVLKLLEVGLSHSGIMSIAYSGISIMIKRWSVKRMETILKVNDNSNRFLIANFVEKVIYSLINLYNDLANMDDVIIQYVNTVYEKPKRVK